MPAVAQKEQEAQVEQEPQKLLRFKIRDGVWYGPDKQPYYKGTIIETDKDLAKAHPSKFIDLNKPQNEDQVVRVVQMKGDLSEADALRVADGRAEVIKKPAQIDESPNAPWRTISVENQPFDDTMLKALVEAEIYTLGSAYDVYKDKGTLTSIKGIGKASEMKLLEAVKSAQ